MKLLGALGLDWKMFLIQALNFLILFLILKKLFFERFIASLKKEKLKEEEMRKAKENIEKQKMDWQKEKESEMAEIKKRVNDMLANAKIFAHRIEKENTEKFMEEQKNLLERISRQSQSIADEYRKNMVRDYKRKIISGIIEIFKAELSDKSKTNLQDNFWLPFMKKVNLVEESAISKFFQRYKEKALPVTIYSAVPLRNVQKNDLRMALKMKLPPSDARIISRFKKELPSKRFKIKEIVNEDLIAGFQLELSGILIEENLKAKIEQIVADRK